VKRGQPAARSARQAVFVGDRLMIGGAKPHELENSVRPAKGMTYKRVETPSGKVRAIPPAANSVQLAATPGVKRGK